MNTITTENENKTVMFRNTTTWSKPLLPPLLVKACMTE